MTVRDLLRRAARRPSRSKRIDQPDPGELLEVGWVSGVCLLADVRVFRDLGGFDPAYFLYYEDQDLCRAVHAAGHAVLKSGDGRIVHASHGTMGTEWRRKLRNYRSLVRFLVRPRRRPSP
jgi:GT2 family glycosyltransferase